MPPMKHVICKQTLFMLQDNTNSGIPKIPEQVEGVNNTIVFNGANDYKISSYSLSPSMWIVHNPDTNKDYVVTFTGILELSEEEFEVTHRGVVNEAKNPNSELSDIVAFLYIIGGNNKCQCVSFHMGTVS